VTAARRAETLESICETVADYRAGEVERPTPSHLERWVCQFPELIQGALLSELDLVLKQTYVSRRAMERYLLSILTNDELAGTEPSGFWARTKVLRIQQHGQSQMEMLSLFERGLTDLFGLRLDDCDGSSDQFVYFDDVLFSGNRIGSDLSAWIATDAPPTGQVHIIVHTSHTLGEFQCINRLKRAREAAGKDIRFQLWAATGLENRVTYRDTSEVLWPVEVGSDPAVIEYVSSLHKFPFKPRHSGAHLSPFSSEGARQLLEREFLNAGAAIRSRHANPSAMMRPLGYSSYGLGFGSLIVTYRNCPNNVPLALWWGLGGWYPLFPRKTYSDEA
jgi:hypothetical protein